MKLGVSTGSWITKEPFKVLRSLAQEFKHIEIMSEFPFSLRFFKDHLSDLKSLSKEFEVKFGIHAPFSCINLGHPEEEHRKSSTKILIKNLDLLDKLDGEYVNFHVGFFRYVTKIFQEDKEVREMHLQRSLQELKKVVKHAENLGLTVCIETDRKESLFTEPEVFIKVFKEIPSDNFGLTLDTTHTYYAGQEKLLLEFIDKFKNKLELIHISDGKFEGDDYITHLATGDGEVNWKNFFQKLKEVKFNKLIVIETFGSRPDYFKKTKDYLLKNFSDIFK